MLAFSRLAPIIDYKKCHKVIPIRFFSDSFGGSFENDPWQLKTDGIYLIYSFCDPDFITIPNTQCMEASIPPEDKAITRSIFHLSTYFDARQYSEISQKKETCISNICFIILAIHFPVYGCSDNGTVSDHFNGVRG